jgi:hypothetical protein
MQILCTWNAIKQICLWSTMQCLSGWHLLASETRSNNQLKKALLLAFISIYLAILFDHFCIYIYRDFILKHYQNNYAYEIPHKVWTSSKWNAVKQPTKKGVIVGLYFRLLSNFIWPLLNLQMQILYTWNTIKQLYLWSTTQCLNDWHLLASETRSNNQLKKALLSAFISIYSATLFNHFWIYTYKDSVLETLSNNYAYEVPYNIWVSSKWNTVKQPTENALLLVFIFIYLATLFDHF